MDNLVGVKMGAMQAVTAPLGAEIEAREQHLLMAVIMGVVQAIMVMDHMLLVAAVEQLGTVEVVEEAGAQAMAE